VPECQKDIAFASVAVEVTPQPKPLLPPWWPFVVAFGAAEVVAAFVAVAVLLPRHFVDVPMALGFVDVEQRPAVGQFAGQSLVAVQLFSLSFCPHCLLVDLTLLRIIVHTYININLRKIQ
jgi:hypothetical protein